MSDTNGGPANSDRPELPEGWEWKPLGEVAKTSSGGTPSRKRRDFFEGGTIPWLKIGDLNDSVVVDSEERITATGLAESSAKWVPAGTLLIAMYGSIGKLGILGVDAATNQAICALEPGDKIDRDFLYWYLRSQREALLAAGFGGTQANISQTFLKALPVPVPPLENQRRIVAWLAALRERLDVGEASVEESEISLAELGRAVLGATVQGRRFAGTGEVKPGPGGPDPIVEQVSWRGGPRSANSGNVPQMDLELPSGWTTARWGDVGRSQNGRAFPSADYSNAGVKLLRPGNLHASGEIRWDTENTRYLPDAYKANYPDFIVRGGELVINLTAQSLRDAFLGRVCMTAPGELCLLNQRIARLTPVSLLPEYVFHVFRSPVFRYFVAGLNKGSLIQHIFTSEIDDFVLPVPPLAEQERIVSDLRKHEDVLIALGEAVNDAQTRARDLWNASLHRAFGGQVSA